MLKQADKDACSTPRQPSSGSAHLGHEQTNNVCLFNMGPSSCPQGDHLFEASFLFSCPPRLLMAFLPPQVQALYMMSMGLINRITLVFASNWWDTGARNGKMDTACWIDRLTSDNTNTPWFEFYSLTGILNRPMLIAFNSGNVAAAVRTIKNGRAPAVLVSSLDQSIHSRPRLC